MTAYDEALRIKYLNTRLIRDLESQITTRDRDKTGLRWLFTGTGERSLNFQTDCYHGYYGNSSVSCCNSKELGAEIAKTLDSLKHEIIKRTVERLKKEITDAAIAAKTEAEGVLAAMSTEPAATS